MLDHSSPARLPILDNLADKVLAYIQATGEGGQVKVKFSSPWLEPVEVAIELK